MGRKSHFRRRKELVPPVFPPAQPPWDALHPYPLFLRLPVYSPGLSHFSLFSFPGQQL